MVCPKDAIELVHPADEPCKILFRTRKLERINKKPFESLKMESKRLFSDKNHSAHKPEQQSSIDGTKHFFAADPVPVAEGKSAHSSQKT